MKSTYPHIIPDISKWPIFKISERRGDFIKELNSFTKERLLSDSNHTTEELLEKTIYLEKIRVKNNPWKVDPADDKTYWNDLTAEIKVAKKNPNTEELLDQILDRVINRYNEEIVGNFKIKTFKFARRFLTSLFKRLLNPITFKGQKKLWGNRAQLQEKFKVTGHVEDVRTLFEQGTVVVLPTHFSNLDSILIGYAMDAVVGIPAFSYGAGLNLLDNEIVAYFINRLGAYRVDRRKKNPIYLECLKSQASFSLQQGVNQIFFPGGTRSRNGMLEDKLKLGLIGSLVEAQRQAFESKSGNKIYVVPLILNYHFVLEANSLINQYLVRTGKEKYTRSRSKQLPSASMMKFFKSIMKENSEVILSFGQPMDVFGNNVDGDGNSLDKNGEKINIDGYFQLEGELQKVHQREKVYAKLLGEKVVESYSKYNVVLSSSLMAFAAFKILLAQHKDLNLYDVLNLPAKSFVTPYETFVKVVRKMQSALKKMEKQGILMLSEPFELSTEKLIENGLDMLGSYHPQDVLTQNKEGELVSENFRLLYFYHNRLDSYQLEDAVDWENIQLIENLIV